MTLPQIIERLERIEVMWSSESSSPRVRAIEQLRLELERIVLRDKELARL